MRTHLAMRKVATLQVHYSTIVLVLILDMFWNTTLLYRNADLSLGLEKSNKVLGMKANKSIFHQ